MLFNSYQFLLFFPIVTLIYFVIPKKIKHIWLLVASYYFYMCWNALYVILLLFTTAVTFLFGILMDRIEHKEWPAKKITKHKKWYVAGSFVLNLAVLFYFKYTNFAIETLNSLLATIHVNLTINKFDILLPVGISFFTFQALSYTMDLYRGEIYAEKNFFRYALFVSFFPQLVAGPIERSKNLLKQLATPAKFKFDNLREGLLLMIYGFFLKIVLADRISIFVDTVYGDTQMYGGVYLIVATVLFAFQIYCDFAGYSTIAMGASKILGIQLMENFNAPYLAVSVTDFWRRWHISLSTWFKDYLYIPLGGNRYGKARKHVNKMIVFLASGLWHGAEWSYVIWGGVNGIYQVIGECLMPIRDKLVQVFHLKRETFSHKIYRIIGTFILVDFSWIFFRASNIQQAIDVVKSIFTVYNPWILFDDSLYNCGLGRKDFNVMLISLLILVLMDVFKNRGIKVRLKIMEQEYWFRWFFIVAAITLILIFGIWGNAYEASSFIYFQF